MESKGRIVALYGAIFSALSVFIFMFMLVYRNSGYDNLPSWFDVVGFYKARFGDGPIQWVQYIYHGVIEVTEFLFKYLFSDGWYEWYKPLMQSFVVLLGPIFIAGVLFSISLFGFLALFEGVSVLFSLIYIFIVAVIEPNRDGLLPIVSYWTGGNGYPPAEVTTPVVSFSRLFFALA